MEYDTDTPKSWTNDTTSFANDSVLRRWPMILNDAAGDVKRALAKIEEPEAVAEGQKILEQLDELLSDMRQNHPLKPITDDSFPDEVAAYNKELQQLGNPVWREVPWLFAECYMYRQISAFFSASKHWKNYDIFAHQKAETFRASRNAVLELATKYKELMQQLRAEGNTKKDAETEKILFAEMIEICLWGNATDLSLLTSLTYEDIQNLQGAEARKAAEKNILANDIAPTYELLAKARAEGKTERRVDIVLDNAGFELFVDLILAGYLISSGLATQIVIHPKSIPWFVSDVLPKDFAGLLNAVANPRAYFESASEDEVSQGKSSTPLTDKEVEELSFLFQEWASLHSEGQLIMRPNRYWTAGGSFWRLPKEAPQLYEDLKQADLVIFKGDLNYRKLTGDAQWDPTTPFATAIGPMGRESGISVLSLRTCKADVVVGLPPGKDEELRATDGGGGDSGARKWAWFGKWAVVSLSESS